MSKLLGLKLPQRHKPDKRAFSLRPRKVEAWLDALPRANLGETARLIYQSLTETNQQEHPFAERARFLEHMREPVQYVTDSMRKHFLGITFPLPEKNRKIATATREIYLALATGYKIAIEDVLRSHVLFQDKKLLATLLYRALTYTGRALLTCYQVYTPYPSRTWKELHTLYAYAEQRKLHKTAISDYQHHFVDKTSLQQEYGRLLLLSLASPYQLRRGEVIKVYDVLERWIRQFEIGALNRRPEPENKALFVVRLDKDAPPRPLAYTVFKTDQPQLYRILNTEKLTTSIRQEMQQNAKAVSTTLTGVDLSRADLSHDLLQRLLVAWGAAAKRNYPRSQKHEDVELTIGLNATHRLISQMASRQAGERDLFEQRAHYQSHEVKSLNQQAPDVWDMVYETDASAFDTSDIAPMVNEELRYAPTLTDIVKPPASPDNYQPGSWAILNESATGYCLEYGNQQTTRAQVGELIGIRRRRSGQTWKWGIGVIRWLKFSAGNTLQMGIEMLNPAAAAIGIRPSAVSNHPENYQRTLMLPEIHAMHQPATLITSAVPWRVGQHAVINMLGKEMSVTLTHAMQNTGLFAQFRFQLDAQASRPSAGESGHATEDFDLSQVWNTI